MFSWKNSLDKMLATREKHGFVLFTKHEQL